MKTSSPGVFQCFTPGMGQSVGFDIGKLLSNGLPGMDPPKTLEDYLDIIIILFDRSKSEWSNSVALNSFDIQTAEIYRNNSTSQEKINDLMLGFISELSKLEITVSLTVDIIPEKITYNVTQDEINAVNKSIIDSIKKNMEQGKFNPIITLNLHSPTIWDHPIINEYLYLSYNFGQPLIQNRITGVISSEDSKPNLDLITTDTLNLRYGGIHGNANNIGVAGGICINLDEIAYNSNSESEFLKRVDKTIDSILSIFQSHVESLNKMLDGSSMPLTKHLTEGDLKLFSVISIVGMNEALNKLIDAPLGHVAGKAVTYQLLEFLLKKIETIQLETGMLLSLESYPSELPGSKMLEQSNSETRTLTPSTQLSHLHGNELWDAFEHQKKIDSMYTGGTLQQVYPRDQLVYHESCKLLIKRILETFGFNYLGITPHFTIPSVSKTDPLKENTTFTRVDGKLTLLNDIPETLKEVYWTRVHYDIKNR